MKKIYFILAVTLCFAACNNEKNTAMQPRPDADPKQTEVIIASQLTDTVFKEMVRSYALMDTSKIRWYGRPPSSYLPDYNQREQYVIYDLASFNTLMDHVGSKHRNVTPTHMATHFIYYDTTKTVVRYYLNSKGKLYYNTRVSTAIEFLVYNPKTGKLDRIPDGPGKYEVYNLGEICPSYCPINNNN